MEEELTSVIDSEEKSCTNELLVASCSLGGAAFALDQAIEYSKTRKQFGRSISDFQYLQFKMADMATDLISSRLMVRNAAKAIDDEVKFLKSLKVLTHLIIIIESSKVRICRYGQERRNR